MSLLPMLFSSWWESLNHVHRLDNQDFALPINNIYFPSSRYRNYQHPFDVINYRRSRFITPRYQEEEKYSVSLDVGKFNPDDITVKVADNVITVQAGHELILDEHGTVSREFERNYDIPEEYDVDEAKSELSSDGVLTISVPRKKLEGERAILIEYIPYPAVIEVAPGVGEQERPRSPNRRPRYNGSVAAG
ncbi:protein lethal(2)essential for life-like [Microplitis mediator]|uniref:protein lethal(2)essential for life-like n=1 Tax=Microplitis mediator TaxID=375433 RepID=UPI002554C36C|nr:protein lethal(2)essential for life-like [Microplitis mediator]